jgi:predicted dithiol-disulfide oxidoreductase (DUF899 family)
VAVGKGVYNYVGGPVGRGEQSGVSVFYKEPTGAIFHTYSTYARGDETVLGTYVILDLTPKGRNETGPHHNMLDWIRHHDRYDASGYVDGTGRFIAGAKPCCHADAEPA